MLLVTAAATKSTTTTTTTTNSQMDTHYDFQFRQQHQPSTFHGPARQFGSGGKGAFAMRMGRVAMSLMEKDDLPVAKEFGRNLFSSFVTELANIVSGKGEFLERSEKFRKIQLPNRSPRLPGRAALPRQAPDRLRRYRRNGGRARETLRAAGWAGTSS